MWLGNVAGSACESSCLEILNPECHRQVPLLNVYGDEKMRNGLGLHATREQLLMVNVHKHVRRSVVITVDTRALCTTNRARSCTGALREGAHGRPRKTTTCSVSDAAASRTRTDRAVATREICASARSSLGHKLALGLQCMRCKLCTFAITQLPHAT